MAYNSRDIVKAVYYIVGCETNLKRFKVNALCIREEIIEF